MRNDTIQAIQCKWKEQASTEALTVFIELVINRNQPVFFELPQFICLYLEWLVHFLVNLVWLFILKEKKRITVYNGGRYDTCSDNIFFRYEPCQWFWYCDYRLTMFSQNHQIHLCRRAVPKHNLRENNFASNLHCYISTTVGDREAKVQQCSANLQST